MRLGIVGSRNFNDYSTFKRCVEELISMNEIMKVISGGHTDKYGKIKSGTDTLAWKWAVENNLDIVEHNAEWEKYGKKVG